MAPFISVRPTTVRQTRSAFFQHHAVRLWRRPTAGLRTWPTSLHSLCGPGQWADRLVRRVSSSFRRRLASRRCHGSWRSYVRSRATDSLFRRSQTVVSTKPSAIKRWQVRRDDARHCHPAEISCRCNHRGRRRQLLCLSSQRWSRSTSSSTATYASTSTPQLSPRRVM